MADNIELDDADLLPIADAPDEAPADAGKSSLDDIIAQTLDDNEGSDAAAEDRARDEKGRFAPKTESEADPAPEGTSEAEPVVSAEPAPNAQPEPISEGHFRGWSPEQRDAFSKLPPEAQKIALDVVKGRDQFYSERLAEYDQAVKATTPLVNAVHPHLDRIRTVTNDPSSYVAHVLDIDHRLQYAPYAEKVQLLTQLAQNIGVPFQAPEADPFADPLSPVGQAYPVVHDLKNQVSQLQAQLHTFRTQNEAVQQQQVSHQIRDFATQTNADGSPKHVFFEIVKGDMGQRLKDGTAKTMEEAYAEAVKPIEAALAARVATQTKAAEAAKQAALEKAKKVRPVRTTGVVPGGRTSAGGLDNAVASALDRAGYQ